ncbi:MAG: hypothetical protein ACK4UP_07275 [Spirosomataceae bacterium]
MKLYRTQRGCIIEFNREYYLSKHTDWDVFVNREELFFSLARETDALESDFALLTALRGNPLPPIGNQPVWGCWSESLKEEAMTFFYKGNHEITVGTNASLQPQSRDQVHTLSVCLAFFVSKSGQIIGATIAHDVMNQSVYETNKAALGLAKNYNKSLGLGPNLVIFDQVPPSFFQIRLEFFRDGSCIQTQHKEISLNTFELTQRIRKVRENRTFIHGFYYLTQPLSLDFSNKVVQSGDLIQTTILDIGLLKNTYIHV